MDEMGTESTGNEAPSRSPENLPTKYARANLRRALADRLIFSEAVELIGQLIACYPNGGGQEKSYIGALAAVLVEYPRMVAQECCDVTKGVARTSHFLPTPATLVAFCDARREHLTSWSQSADKAARHSKPYPIGGKPGDNFGVPLTTRATRVGLMEHYRLTVIPPGWDAIDVCQAAARHGDGLAEFAEDVAAGRADWRRASAMRTVGQSARAYHAPTAADLRELYAKKLGETADHLAHGTIYEGAPLLDD